MKFSRQVSTVSLAGGKSFSAACLLRLSLLLSVDTLELFINPANFATGISDVGERGGGGGIYF